ncbi:uncharacterized protein LOC144472455 isoform X1 [Augochlora pura]
MRMPAESSIYWDSVGSQRSTSGGSSGDACSSGSASRHYVDPWDLENYAYLRRHSVAGPTQQAPSPRRNHRRPAHHLSHEARAQSEYWYSSSVREPGYDAPAFVEELYCGPPRPANNSCYYQQPIYEDEVPDYVAPFPVYAPLSEIRHGGEFMEDHRRFRHRCKSTSMRDLHRSDLVDLQVPAATPIQIGKFSKHFKFKYNLLRETIVVDKRAINYPIIINYFQMLHVVWSRTTIRWCK